MATKTVLNPAEYFVSDKLGFVLENPLCALPGYFESWNRLAKDMEQLVTSRTMREHVQQMPVLDWKRLEGHRQKRLAHFQLAIIASGYIFQNGNATPSKSLPASVAVPLYHVSQELGLPPVLCHADLALANYTAVDNSRPLTLENIQTVYCLCGGEESGWFFRVTTAIELAFAECIKPIMTILEGVRNDDVTSVVSSLKHIAEVVRTMKQLLKRMHENLSSHTFYNVLRPVLEGWGGENSSLPEGLIYEGVSEHPIQVIGPTAAQSPTLQTLDALLGIQHSPEKTAFLQKMRSHMPPSHRHFIEAIEKQPTCLGDFVNSNDNTELGDAYKDVLSAIVDFRSYHIQVVAKFIVQASSKTRQAQGKSSEGHVCRGAGGIHIMPFLKELRQDSKDHMSQTRTQAAKDGSWVIVRGS